MANVKGYIDKEVQKKKVVIFGVVGCQNCSKVRQIFFTYLKRVINERDFEVINIDCLTDDDDQKTKMKAIQKYMQEITGSSEMPRVFVDGKCVGGAAEVSELDKQGKLRELLMPPSIF